MGGMVDMSGMMGAAAGGGLSIAGLDFMYVLKYVAVLLGGGALLGLVTGKIFAGIRYPNPEKRQLFRGWQKIILLVVSLASIGLIFGALFYSDKGADGAMDPALAVSGEMGGMAGMDGMGADGTGADGMGTGGAAGTGDAEAGANAGADATVDGEADEGDASASESGTEESTASTESGGSTGNGAAARPAGGGGAVMIGGGGAIAVPMF